MEQEIFVMLVAIFITLMAIWCELRTANKALTELLLQGEVLKLRGGSDDDL